MDRIDACPRWEAPWIRGGRHLKNPTSTSTLTLAQRITQASEQSPFVVVHPVNAINRDAAEQALNRALSRGGEFLRRVVIVVDGGDGYVEWNAGV